MRNKKGGNVSYPHKDITLYEFKRCYYYWKTNWEASLGYTARSNKEQRVAKLSAICCTPGNPAGKDWGQGEKGWDGQKHHQLIGHEFEQALRDGEGQRSLACCSPWGRKESHDWVTDNSNNQALRGRSMDKAYHRFANKGAHVTFV